MTDAWSKVPVQARAYVYHTLTSEIAQFQRNHVFEDLGSELDRIADASVEMPSAGEGIVGASLDLTVQFAAEHSRKVTEARRAVSLNVVLAESLKVALASLKALALDDAPDEDDDDE